jgi:hypothetical protein
MARHRRGASLDASVATAAGLDSATLQAKRPGRVAQGVKVRSSKASSARAGSSRFSSTLAAGDQAGGGGTYLMRRDYPIGGPGLSPKEHTAL